MDAVVRDLIEFGQTLSPCPRIKSCIKSGAGFRRGRLLIGGRPRRGRLGGAGATIGVEAQSGDDAEMASACQPAADDFANEEFSR
jgi:hypothetical protein